MRCRHHITSQQCNGSKVGGSGGRTSAAAADNYWLTVSISNIICPTLALFLFTSVSLEPDERAPPLKRTERSGAAQVRAGRLAAPAKLAMKLKKHQTQQASFIETQMGGIKVAANQLGRGATGQWEAAAD